MHLETISNGGGAPSIRLLTLAGARRIPGNVAIMADTGSEQDRLWSNGRRTTLRQYYDEVIEPLCNQCSIQSYFVRAEDKDGDPMVSLWEQVKRAARDYAKQGNIGTLPKRSYIPLFGSDGGRLLQTCTSRWKVAAIRQQARKLGATTMRAAQGIHADEAWRRVKGIYAGEVGGWATYYDVDRYEADEEFTQDSFWDEPKTIKGKSRPKAVKWATHYYPLAELKMGRQQIREDLEKMGIPYLISSECDMCPHKDLARWLRSTLEVIEEVAEVEALFLGQFYFTDERIPLKEALKVKEARFKLLPVLNNPIGDDGNFDCTDGVCGV